MRGFRIENTWRRFLILRTHVGHSTKYLCSSTNNANKVTGDAATKTPSIRDFDAYRQLDKLDFMTAAKMLFTAPAKKKKFGLDFHLVQLFFACMPSLAVYLVAQYARYEIRRMEAEVEVKKKQEEEAKLKEMEAKALEEIEAAKSDPELLKVKVRLDALEEAVKEVAVEIKKQSSGSSPKDEGNTKREKVESSKSEIKSGDDSSVVDENRATTQPGSSADSSMSDQSNGGRKTHGADSKDLKK